MISMKYLTGLHNMDACVVSVWGLLLAIGSAMCLGAASIVCQPGHTGNRHTCDKADQHEWMFASPHDTRFQASRSDEYRHRRGVSRRWNDTITPMDSVSQVGHRSRGT